LGKKKKKRGWSLKRLRVGFNVLVGKVDAEFEKDEIPRKPTRKQASRIKKEVRIELSNLAKVERQPQNIVADTISQIADKERKKAIRSGDYGTAIFASIIQHYADEASKNQPSVSTSHW
jgi:ribosomal protein L24